MNMKIEKLLSEKESDILKSWLNTILEQYPSDTKKFLIKNHDQFTNPVGHTLSNVTGCLFQELLKDENVRP